MPYERHVDQYNNLLKSYEEVYFTRKNCILVYAGLKYKNTNKNELLKKAQHNNMLQTRK